LFGKVVSRGYEFEPGAYAEERFIKIAAPYSIGPPAQFVSFQDNLFNLHRVKWRLKELTNAVDSILKEFENGDSVLLFRFNFSKICACLRELHGQIFFLPSNYNECYSVGPLCSALQIRYPPLYSGRTAESISQLMEQILNESLGPLCSALQIRYPPLYSGRTAESISQLMEQILNESRKF
ncbi:unnamed protein product, partial [Brugia pahangi]|uniref:BRCA1-A complex subunit BRE n=1 Tax=Brugia pahangi TaxID=6280 RepID=A0A0N4U0A6_BRUPA